MTQGHKFQRKIGLRFGKFWPCWMPSNFPMMLMP